VREQVDRRRHESGRCDDLFDGDAGLSVDGPSLDSVWQIWQVREALAALPTEERHALLLAYFADRSRTEIPALLDVARGTAKSRAARAHPRLAEMLPHLQREPAGPA
jgi:DNA-directed RNA polymerase specialized sigma24 family protein